MAWFPVVLVAVVGLGVVAVVLLVRARKWSPAMTPEERRELAATPMAPLQKGAWIGLLVSAGTLAILAAIVASRGAMTYWEDDNLRLLVLAIYISGLAAYAAAQALPFTRGRADERDRAILARSGMAKSAGLVLAAAAWVIVLAQKFHDQGAVPVVYLYLMFGSLLLVDMIAQSIGILLGYWIGVGHGEG